MGIREAVEKRTRGKRIRRKILAKIKESKSMIRKYADSIKNTKIMLSA